MQINGLMKLIMQKYGYILRRNSMQKISYRSFKIPMILCMVMMVVMMAAGCGMNLGNSKTKHIEKFLNVLFTDVDEKDYNEVIEAGGNFLPDDKFLPKWVEKGFKVHMTEEGFTSFCETASYHIPTLGFMYEKKLKLENLEITEAEKSYDFTGKLTITSKDDEEKKSELTVEGFAQVDDKGLITYFDIFNINEIVTVIQEDI